MREQLYLLREQMKKNQVDAYLITTDDFHGSEYVGAYFKTREYISGFTGSAGTLLVTMDQAGLWTDGRYFLQAEKQLEGSGITLYKSGQPGVPSLKDFLRNHMKKGQVLGFDGRCVMADFADALEEELREEGVVLRKELDLAGKIWSGRPSISKEPAWFLDMAYAGVSRKEKISKVREILKEKKADWFLLASLEDIAWLLNVRGNDVRCTPVVLSYLLMNENRVIWYVQEESLSKEMKSILEQDGVETAPYESVFDDVSKLGADVSILYDSSHVNAALRAHIPEKTRRIDVQNPTLLLKAVKNPVEVENERIAHKKDGVAVTKFIYWLKKQIGRAQITEISAAQYLENLREQQKNYIGPSFSPIIAYKEHGAIVHYSAKEETNVFLEPKSFVLADTGGHYLEGTTDITRTIALGALTEEEKELYTAVLRGHINLAAARFLRGCTGVSLDGLARTPLWEKGYDYNHGTGHGVGYLLSVHEGPNSFRLRPAAGKNGDCILEEGMITSDEPGVYLEGKFGIRLENVIVCRKDTENGYGSFLKFEPLTMVPFDLDAVLPQQMTQREKNWLNAYHKKVYETLAPSLTKEEAGWLEWATRSI